MTRNPDHCGRCGQKGRRRSMENLRYHGIYACKDCIKKTEGYATFLRYRRAGAYPDVESIDIIADYPTTSRLGVDLLHMIFRMSCLDGESNYVLVGGNLRGFGQLARNSGITCREVGFHEDRREALRQEIDLLSGENLSVIVYPGKYILPAVRRLIERSKQPVIVLADGDAAVEWNKEGALVISVAELPRQHGRGMRAAAPAAAPAQ